MIRKSKWPIIAILNGVGIWFAALSGQQVRKADQLAELINSCNGVLDSCAENVKEGIGLLASDWDENLTLYIVIAIVFMSVAHSLIWAIKNNHIII